MDQLYAPSTIRQIREKYGFKLSKSLGQNFLADKNIIDKIIDGSLIGDEDLVIEIGPGIGVLTKAAALKAKKVIAIEIDRHLIPILSETLADHENIELINEDILKMDLNVLIDHNPGYQAIRIIGNLPYYITTPIIMKVLEEHVAADSMTIMLQKEVADRIKAKPGTKDYGAITVVIQYYCTVDTIAAVPREVFIPRPNVDSTVIRLSINKDKPVSIESETLFFQTIKSGFGQRRKTLLNSLTGLQGLGKGEVGLVLSSAGIDPVRRAETLSIQEFAHLSNAFFEQLKGRPSTL
jgi:16S rRNA (adenine1518-N6/adenine1519-N6)-dimethyltransferase